MASVKCQNPNGDCNNITTDPSGKCYRHQDGHAVSSKTSGNIGSLKMSPSVTPVDQPAPERESVPKAQALRELKSSKSVTITGFRQKNFRTGELDPAKHLFAGVKRKVTTGGAEDSVRFDDDSTLHIDRAHRCYRGDDGELIIQGLDEEGEPWVELTYEVKH